MENVENRVLEVHYLPILNASLAGLSCIRHELNVRATHIDPSKLRLKNSSLWSRRLVPMRPLRFGR